MTLPRAASSMYRSVSVAAMWVTCTVRLERTDDGRTKIQAQDAVQVIEGGLRFLAQIGRILGLLVFIGQVEIVDGAVPGAPYIGRRCQAACLGGLCHRHIVILLVLGCAPIVDVNRRGDCHNDDRNNNGE